MLDVAVLCVRFWYLIFALELSVKSILILSNFLLLCHSSDIKSKISKSEEVAAADSSQHVTSATLTGTEAYDTSYSSAAAYTAAASAYSYSTPLQSQWAAYSAAHPVRFYCHGGVFNSATLLVNRSVQ